MLAMLMGLLAGTAGFAGLMSSSKEEEESTVAEATVPTESSTEKAEIIARLKARQEAEAKAQEKAEILERLMARQEAEAEEQAPQPAPVEPQVQEPAATEEEGLSEAEAKAQEKAEIIARLIARQEAEAQEPAPVEAQAPTPVEAQVQEPAPTEPQEPVITPPQAPAQTVSAEDNSVEAAILGSNLQGSAIAGRVKTLDLNDDSIEKVEILNGPEHGNVTVNPDNTLAVVLSHSDAVTDIQFDLRVTYKNGAVADETVDIDVTEGAQAAGWGPGDFYMLETDENDNVVVEHGENHREVYVSGNEDALSLADIAALENISVESVNGKFLEQHPEYGSSPDMALAADAGNMIWGRLTYNSDTPSSHWLLFEKGYEYDNIPLFKSGTTGESELNPIHITSYGEGDDPIIARNVSSTKQGVENIVIQGLEFTEGVNLLAGKNILIEDSVFRDVETAVIGVEGFTLRGSQILDATDEKPADPETGWKGLSDRESGLYMGKVYGGLIENNLFDHNGWEEGYDEAGGPDSVQPPSQYSHNVYMAKTNLDVTFSDNIVMRGASTGLQIRSGGVVEGNVFLDNNIGVVIGKGGGEPVGNYTLYADNVVTSAGYHTVDQSQGALAFGVDNSGIMATLVDNIVAHVADPNNPVELAEKEGSQPALTEKGGAAYYDDTIIYNWAGANKYDAYRDERDVNIESLNDNTLDQTTIQNFAAQLLGKSSASIDDLADYLRAEADGALDNVATADLIIDFFQTGFGLDADLRTAATTARFIPNDLADGIRWDNTLNWSTRDLPGVQDGDRVELGGNWVQYGGTTTLEDLDFGEGGHLNVTHGALWIENNLLAGDNGATLSVDNSGQFWTDGYADHDMLTIDVDGGRFANTGLFTGTTQLTAADNAQVILASDDADFVLGSGSSLEIIGGNTKVGFDGAENGTGVLLMADDSTLSFTAEDGEIGQIREFYSGHFSGNNSGIQSGVNLGNATLDLNVTHLTGGTESILIDVDQIIGGFGDINITGLGAKQDASIIVDYDADQVLLNLGEAGVGSGSQRVYSKGDANNAQGNSDLWSALTNGHGIYPEDLQEDIPEDPDFVDI